MIENFPHHVFREYDIRGLADDEITVAFAKKLALAYVSFLSAENQKPIVIARDVRLSGEILQKTLCDTLLNAGFDVIDIGMVPTPLAYYTVYELDAAGCIMVTASHNPSAYNGFKMMVGKESFHGEDIQRLKQRMFEVKSHASATKGKLISKDISEAYIDFVIRDCVLGRPLKVVIDAGNGPTGLIAGPLYRALGCEVVELYCEPDGRFPNHHPDPTVEENLKDLAQQVCETNADLGIAFDGDGDRIGVVDEKGEIIWGDMLLLLLSRQLLNIYPGATIISEVKASQLLYDDIHQHGGQGLMWRTGHSPIKAKMKETGALLAGEMSGHFFFADRFFGFDDATYAGARVMQLLAQQEKHLSSLLDDVPKRVSTPEIRLPCPDEVKFKLVESAKVFFTEQGYEMIDIDGIRLKFEQGWALLRASNTQPALVLRYEAEDEQGLQWMKQELEQGLDAAKRGVT